MMGTRRWTAVSSVVTVVVFLVAGSGAPAHSVVPGEAGTRRPAAAPVPPSQSSATAEQARHDGVDANAVVDIVRRRRAPGPAGAVAARPRLGPQHPVADAVPAGASSDQDRPNVAFDGANYLVVWTDARSGAFDADVDVFGARVSRSGAVLDAAGILISTGPGPQYGPDVAFDGTNFLVAWGGTGADASEDVIGTRVSRSGVVLDGAGIAIATGPGDQSWPVVAFDGTNLLVVWTADDGIAATRVTPAGLVLDGPGIPISDATSFEVAIAFDGTNYLVVWTDGGVSGALVSRQGAVVARRTILADPANRTEPAIAFDGTNYLLTWTHYRDGVEGGDIYGTRVDTAGNALDVTPIPVAVAVGYQFAPGITFDGTNFLVTWVDDRFGGVIRGARVTRAGVVLDGGGVPIAAEWGRSTAVAFDGTNSLVLWPFSSPDVGGLPGPADVVGVRVTPALAVVGDKVVVSTAANSQLHPATAFDGTNYLVVWNDTRDGTTRLFGARVTPSGQILDGAGFPVSDPDGFAGPAAVGFDGTNFLVAWGNYRPGGGYGDVRGVRISPAGVVLDSPTIPIATAPSTASSVHLAFDGTNYLVVWIDDGLGARQTRGVRVSRAGTVLDGSPILVSDLYQQGEPAIAFDGDNYVVTGIASSGRVYWVRVAPDGRVVDRHTIIARPSSWSDMAVASDGTNSLVVWTDERDGTSSIWGIRLDRSGNALDPSGFSVSSAPGDQREPAVIANGPYLVVWRDQRRGLYQHDVYGARVRANGQVIDRSGFAVSATSAKEGAPAVAAGPGDRSGVLTQRLVTDPPFGSDRVYLRTVAPK